MVRQQRCERCRVCKMWGDVMPLLEVARFHFGIVSIMALVPGCNLSKIVTEETEDANLKEMTAVNR